MSLLLNSSPDLDWFNWSGMKPDVAVCIADFHRGNRWVHLGWTVFLFNETQWVRWEHCGRTENIVFHAGNEKFDPNDKNWPLREMIPCFAKKAKTIHVVAKTTLAHCAVCNFGTFGSRAKQEPYEINYGIRNDISLDLLRTEVFRFICDLDDTYIKAGLCYHCKALFKNGEWDELARISNWMNGPKHYNLKQIANRKRMLLAKTPKSRPKPDSFFATVQAAAAIQKQTTRKHAKERHQNIH